jgi:hypothetical protein
MTVSCCIRGAVIAALTALPSVARAQTTEFRLSPSPILVIGSEERGPQYQLDRVYGAVRLVDGRVVIGNSATAELRFYDTRGEYATSAGRKGGGPGEFEEPASIFPMVFGNTILANDMSHARLNRYDAAGKVLKQIALTSSPAAVQSIPEATAGSMLIARVTASPELRGEPGQRISTRYRYAIYDSTGRQRTPLFEFPTRERIVHAFGGSIRFPYIPFSAEPVLAASRDRVFLIRQGAPEIEVWSLTAQRIDTFRWNAPRTKVRDIWTRWRQSELEAISRPADRARYEDFYSDRLPLPEFVPVADAMHVDPAGRIWIVRTRLPWEPTTRCDVLDSTGRYRGSVMLPPRFTLFQVGADFMLGRARDYNDVEQVQVYRLIVSSPR